MAPPTCQSAALDRDNDSMPPHIRLIARYGNALLVLSFGIMALAGLQRGQGMAMFCIAVAALGVFNIYILERVVRLLSEEEWLAAEVRKAELRKRLAELEREAAPPPVVTMQLPGPQP